MPTPNQLVADHGDDITILRVVDFEMTPNGATDVIRHIDHTQGVISSPSETDTVRPEGRADTGNRTVTVQSSQDVQVERPGGRDFVALGHIDPDDDLDPDVYTVTNVSDDTHNFLDITKKTLTCEAWTGKHLFDYADYYLVADTLVVESGETYTIPEGEIESYRFADVDGTLTVDGVLNLIGEE